MKYMINATVAVAALFVLTLGTISDASADPAACDLKIKLTDKAEMMEGGAHFKGTPGTAMAGMKMEAMAGMKMDKMPAMKKDAMAGMKMDKKPAKKMGAMAGMKGAHEVHEGQYGGTFFMAPNKTNHVEGIHSKECGFRLVIFNAMTQPINVNRFGAFVKYIPEDEDEPEAYRILSPSHDGSVLQVPSNPEIKGKFDVELYVKFPDSDEPNMFNIRVKH
jgi:hypothetical protein